MNVKLVIDMNLSHDWATFLSEQGWNVVHWSMVGDPRASDEEIMAWSVNNSRVVITHDLDFGMLLAQTHAKGPSVMQLRANDVLPEHLRQTVLAAL